MPVVNPLARELVFKVVYYGPGLGGKTTTLQHIHAVTRPEYRGKMVSLATPVDRTLYFDFLPIRVPSIRGMGVRLQLFTVPGQVYYNATRKLVLTGADGVVLVADSQRGRQDANLESLENLEENLREHGRALQELPLVLQYNKRDLRDVRPLEELDQELNPRGVPSFGTVATTGVGVFESLDQITRLVLADFERRIPAGSDLPATTLQVPEGGLAEALRRADFESEQPTALSSGTPGRSPNTAEDAPARSRVSTRTMPEAGAWQPEEPTEPTSGPGDDETSFAGLSDDAPGEVEPSSDDQELPRLSHVPESTIGEDMARSVAEFGKSRRSEAFDPRLRAGERVLAGVPALELDADEGVEGAQRAAPQDLAASGHASELQAPPESQAAPGLIHGFSFSALFPRSQQRLVRQLEAALANGESSQAVERAEHLVTRTFAAAANLVSQKEAPRDPTLVALMLGLPGQRYLEFRAIARDARSGGVVATEDALIAYAFAVDARLAWRRVGG